MLHITGIARRSSPLVALVALAVCAAPALAGPRGGGGGSAQPAQYPSYPFVIRHPQSQSQSTNVSIIRPHTQAVTRIPIYVPLATLPYATGMLGGFMNGLPLNSNCSSLQQSAPTIGELAPPGNSSFAPVTHSLMSTGSSASNNNWLESLTGGGLGGPSTPWQTTSAQFASQAPTSLGSQCGAQPAFLPALQFGTFGF